MNPSTCAVTHKSYGRGREIKREAAQLLVARTETFSNHKSILLLTNTSKDVKVVQDLRKKANSVSQLDLDVEINT